MLTELNIGDRDTGDWRLDSRLLLETESGPAGGAGLLDTEPSAPEGFRSVETGARLDNMSDRLSPEDKLRTCATTFMYSANRL